MHHANAGRIIFLACAVAVLELPSTSAVAAVHWVGTWAASAQPARPGSEPTFHGQSVRLIAHTSIGGRKLRVRLSNVYGDKPVRVGSACVARRTSAAEIDASSSRPLTFGGRKSTTVAAGSVAVSDPAELDVPALSDVAISLFFPETAVVGTSHQLALQTSYVSAEGSDATADAKFPVAKTITWWPLLTGVDVAASSRGASIVAFGSSTTDGDGSSRDANRRWPDVLAERLHETGLELGVLNEGIIGNRLLNDSPRSASNPFGPILGEAGVTRFKRDVLDQPGVKFVMIGLGVNDILFPAFPFTPPSETVTADQIIAGYRQLVARAHSKGVRAIGTTIPPFEGATFKAAGLDLALFTPERERVRAAVNEWIRSGGGFDGVVDFDAAVRDPARPAQLLPAYAAPDRLHINDAGNVAQAGAVSLALFERR
jgi:lysophospholipase L1-like esterase